MYESPITIAEKIVNKAREQMENDILTATVEYGVVVDKDELIKALQYDRKQYYKGYEDAYKECIEKLKKLDFERYDDVISFSFADLNRALGLYDGPFTGGDY